MVMRLADAPELTKTLDLTPSHSDHSLSKWCTLSPWVRRGCPFKNSMRTFRSSIVILFSIKGQFSFMIIFLLSCRVLVVEFLFLFKKTQTRFHVFLKASSTDHIGLHSKYLSSWVSNRFIGIPSGFDSSNVTFL